MNQRSRFKGGSSEERRGYARILDAVGLKVRRLEPGEVVNLQTNRPDADTISPEIWHPYARIDELRAKDPDAARHIELLESLLLEGNKDRDASSQAAALPTHKVSLSGSGIAFAHNLVLQPGDKMVLGITLFPSREYIEVMAMVISVGGASNSFVGGRHAARAVFSDIDAQVREKIVRHIEFVQGEM